MPKREPTPPLEDELKHLVVNYPFPLHANMQIDVERKELAHWMASCIGQNNLAAIYYKPSAPNMVIIEVMKTCPRINALLGAHKWCEFLRYPAPDQIDKESRIYYCRYSSGREVQKHGWRRYDVCDHWFNNYDPVNGAFITNPYPKASFCDVPPETQTDYGLCRPLPSDVFPRPKPTSKQTIVPGSELYVKNKETGMHSIVAPAPINESVKRLASVISSSASHKTEVEWPQPTSRASSEGSSSLASPSEAISAPPGLGPPPGLSVNLSHTSSDFGFEPSPGVTTPSTTTDWVPTMDIITSGLAAAAIEDQQNSYTNGADEEDNVQYWAEQPVRPVDWDKPICPVHKISCRPGICKVMDEIEKNKKRKEKNGRAPQNDDNGWVSVKARGRGRGRARGQGGGRGGSARGNGTASGRGGGGWV